MIPTTHPISIALQILMVSLEFGMVVLNGIALFFYLATASYILAPVCIVMGYRHAVNARRVYRHQLATSQQIVAAL